MFKQSRKLLLLIPVLCCGILAATPMLSSYSRPREQVRGSGRVTQETRPVSAFHAVEASGTGEVIVTQGDTDSLRVEAEDNILPYLATEVRDGVLHLHTRKGNVGLSPHKPIRYLVSARQLDSLTLSGATALRAEKLRANRLRLDFAGVAKVRLNGISADALDVNASGAADIEIAGSLSRQDLGLSGTARYRGNSLRSEQIRVKASGVSSASLQASQSLDVEASGMAKIQYTGSPRVTQRVSGLASVTPADKR